jgi:hypothetical protein
MDKMGFPASYRVPKERNFSPTKDFSIQIIAFKSNEIGFNWSEKRKKS